MYELCNSGVFNLGIISTGICSHLTSSSVSRDDFCAISPHSAFTPASKPLSLLTHESWDCNSFSTTSSNLSNSDSKSLSMSNSGASFWTTTWKKYSQTVRYFNSLCIQLQTETQNRTEMSTRVSNSTKAQYKNYWQGGHLELFWKNSHFLNRMKIFI